MCFYLIVLISKYKVNVYCQAVGLLQQGFGLVTVINLSSTDNLTAILYAVNDIRLENCNVPSPSDDQVYTIYM